MPSYRDEAVVLRTYKLGEADRILTLLTKHHGRVRAVAKGVRRTSSKFGARLEPFMVADVQLYQGRSLDIVQQAEGIGSYGSGIVLEYDRYTAANVMVETADRLGDAEANIQQYVLLVGGLRALSRGEHDSRSIVDSYLLRVMSLSGWAPDLVNCARCSAPGPHSAFFSQYGGMVCNSCAPPGSVRVSHGTLVALQSLRTGDWETLEGISTADANAASGIIAAYAQLYLDREIRSLELVGNR